MTVGAEVLMGWNGGTVGGSSVAGALRGGRCFGPLVLREMNSSKIAFPKPFLSAKRMVFMNATYHSAMVPAGACKIPFEAAKAMRAAKASLAWRCFVSILKSA